MKKAATIFLILATFSYLYSNQRIKDMPKLQNLTGRTVNNFTVLKIHGRTGSGRRLFTLWLCKCNDCGHEFTARTGAINYGDAACAPCSYKRKVTHGMVESMEYKSWRSMKSRCLNPKDDNYADYGGRGISVSQEWVNSFETFFADMGRKPSSKHSIERIDVNGNYEPSNCRWATMTEQANNRRNNTRLTFRGITLNQKEWCNKLGLCESTVHNRILKGMSIEDALTIPVRPKIV